MNDCAILPKVALHVGGVGVERIGGTMRKRQNRISSEVQQLLYLVICLLAGSTGCSSADEPCLAIEGTASISALVRDSAGNPVKDVTIKTNTWGGRTDQTGRSCVRDLAPGSNRVVTWRFGFVSDSIQLDLEADSVAELEFRLKRLPPPCCELDGIWKIFLTMEEPAPLHPNPESNVASGLVVFDSRLPLPDFRPYSFEDPIVHHDGGRHTVDLRPLFGSRVAPDVSTTVFGGGPSLIWETVGFIETLDKVRITIIPRMSHGGLSLSGLIEGETIVGRWKQNAFMDGADGSFRMERLNWSEVADSIVEAGVQEHLEELRIADSIEAAWQRRVGKLRVRTYDEATERYIKAEYTIEFQSEEPGG